MIIELVCDCSLKSEKPDWSSCAGNLISDGLKPLLSSTLDLNQHSSKGPTRPISLKGRLWPG